MKKNKKKTGKFVNRKRIKRGKEKKLKNLSFFLIIPILLIFILIVVLYGQRDNNSNDNNSSSVLNENQTDRVVRKDAELTIVDNLGYVKAELGVEVADNDLKRNRGLMFVREMAMNKGMLFVFEEATLQSFWMKNTFIPLDLIFIDENLVIVEVFENAEPESLAPIISNLPSMYVLEVNAGFVKGKNIQTGDKILIK